MKTFVKVDKKGTFLIQTPMPVYSCSIRYVTVADLSNYVMNIFGAIKCGFCVIVELYVHDDDEMMMMR